jgi:GT2 family glycosyltransferase
MQKNPVSTDRKDEQPPVTVALFSYNQADTVTQALDGVLRQTYPIDQLIVSDDCSTDDTWRRINEYFAGREMPASLIGDVTLRRNSRNQGLMGHVGHVLSLVRNDLFMGHAGDDVSHPERLRKCVELYASLGCPRDFLVHTDARIIDKPGQPVWVPPVVQANMGTQQGALSLALHIGATAMFTKNLWHDFDGVAYPGVYEDLILGFRAFLRDAYHYIAEPLVDYRMHGGLGDPEAQANTPERHAAMLQRQHDVYCQRMLDAGRVGRADLVDLLSEALAQLRANGVGAGKQGARVPERDTGVPAQPPAVARAVAASGLPQERQWADLAVAAWEAGETPVPTFGLALLEHGTISSSPTRESLDAQWLGCRRIDIAPKADPSALLAELNTALPASEGDWLGLIDAGCTLAPQALFRIAQAIRRHPDWALVYTDEDSLTEDGLYGNPHFKPDFNLDYLRSLPYVGGLVLIRRDLFEALGGFDPEAVGADEYDLVLRAWERLEAAGQGDRAIGHVAEVFYHRMPGAGHAVLPLAETLAAAQGALRRHFSRCGVDVQIEPGVLPATQRVRYRHATTPLVSIIIPTRNQRAMLERCLESLFSHTAWPSYEILVVDNGSDEADALQYLDGLRTLGRELEGRLRVLDYPQPFNYSAMNNLAAEQARGEYLLLLNNDTAALHDEWLDVMMAHAQRPEVGVVGAKLLYPDGKVQHAGVVLGVNGPAEHPFIGHEAKEPGYYARLQVDQDYSAVTGACLLVRKTLFDEVGGLDADELAVSYSDIDLCLKIRERGKLVVWSPYALMLHEGSKSQKSGVESAGDQVKLERFGREQAVMYRRWMRQIAGDPAYNRHLSLKSTDFVAESDPALCWDPGWRPVPRIIAQPADRMGCGEYRIIAPARALIEAGRIQGQETDCIYAPAELARIKPDALVLQRQVEPHQIEAVERHKRFNDVFCVFEIDDLVTNVPVKNAHKKHLPKDLYKRLRRAVGVCDRLVVATEPLAEAYSGLNADIKVVPNFIEEARWGGLSSTRGVGSKPRVGWAGGISHTGDLELIAGVVEALKDEVEWVFFGMCPERVRPYVHEFHEPVSIEQYAARLAGLNLDLALAPLEDVPFNHAKSHLRLLEYGILGYPVVCSDLTPYRGDFPVTRVRNRHRDWVEAIREHVTDLAASAERGDVLRAHVRKHWLLENNLDVWLEGWLA